MRRRVDVYVLVLLVCLAVAAPTIAATEVPRTAALRIDPERAPEIDGRLDDSIWADATPVHELRQSVPDAGAAATQRTEIRILTDGKQLYFGVRCFDTDPDLIIAQRMARDARLNAEDRFSVVLDTFHDRRNGYFFQLNPLGAKVDALLDRGSFRRDWDGIWYGRARIDEQGWTAEFAIPFDTLNFDPGGDVWGLNLVRTIRRNNEQVRWSRPDPNVSFINVATAGDLEGMLESEQGWGLDVVPGLTARYVNEGIEDRSYSKLEPSLDVSYKFTPSLTGVLTFNPNFAEAAVDEQIVNLTRFALFFPEQRAFFLQDAGIFDFGGLARSGRPFFSRRVGRNADGDPVPIRVGAKLTGRVKRLNVGVLDVYQKEDGDIEAKNLAVARVSVNVLGESTVGGIFTYGDPTSNDDNYLWGLDFNYRNSKFRGDKQLVGGLFFQRSASSGVDRDQAAWGARIAYPNDKINWNLSYGEFQEQFNPALGFVSRTDVRDYRGSYRYRWRPEGVVRIVDTRIAGRLVTDTTNVIETGVVTVTPVTLENALGDRISLLYEFRNELLDPEDADAVVPGITIEPGRYQWSRVAATIATSGARAIDASLTLSWGGFWSGRRLQFLAKLGWRPTRHWLIALEYDQSNIDLLEGDTTLRTARARVNLQFNPDVSWNTFVQWNNDDDRVAINSRLRWIIRPGREFFLVFNQTFEEVDGRYQRGLSEPIAKLFWTFRF